MKRNTFQIMILSLCLVLTLFSGCSKKTDNGDNTPGSGGTTDDNATDGTPLTGKVKVEIEVESYGKIMLELDADAAPITVTNFVKLVNDKFYDGLTFHRVIKGFMIQGGDPNHNGSGGSKDEIKGEFANNGYENPISHVRGTVSMARAEDFDSASSQFFICDADVTDLDGQYAAFGKVTEGMDVVDSITAKTPVTDDNGTVTFENQPVIKTIRVVE